MGGFDDGDGWVHDLELRGIAGSESVDFARHLSRDLQRLWAIRVQDIVCLDIAPRLAKGGDSD